MTHEITRYENRKLYDPEASRYVSLTELAEWIREGEEIRVVDKGSGEDVTIQTLGQIIADEGRRGGSLINTTRLQELLRAGGGAIQTGANRVGRGVGRLWKASKERLSSIGKAREEIAQMQGRLETLETSLREMEQQAAAQAEAQRKAATPKRKAKRKTKTGAKAKVSVKRKGGSTKARTGRS
jgi:polyhydroxyalkanoate synthesis repressor PhaR